MPDVLTSELVNCEHSELLAENRELRRRVALLGAIVGVFVAFEKAACFSCARRMGRRFV